MCCWKTKPFLFGTLCHCEKCRGFGLFVRTLLFWEFAISFFLPCFIFLNEIKSLSMYVFENPLCSLVLCLVHLLNFENQSFVDLFG